MSESEISAALGQDPFFRSDPRAERLIDAMLEEELTHAAISENDSKKCARFETSNEQIALSFGETRHLIAYLKPDLESPAAENAKALSELFTDLLSQIDERERLW